MSKSITVNTEAIEVILDRLTLEELKALSLVIDGVIQKRQQSGAAIEKELSSKIDDICKSLGVPKRVFKGEGQTQVPILLQPKVDMDAAEPGGRTINLPSERHRFFEHDEIQMQEIIVENITPGIHKLIWCRCPIEKMIINGIMNPLHHTNYTDGHEDEAREIIRASFNAAIPLTQQQYYNATTLPKSEWVGSLAGHFQPIPEPDAIVKTNTEVEEWA